MTQILQNHTHSPLIDIIVEEKGKEVVRYFTEEEQADRASGALKKHLAWPVLRSDLDLDETLDSLDQIRHESKPTPPIKL
jgi:hypothetical protein